ncbi:MAG: GntR family transcriptional regulator [Limnochordia bacterium]|nr:GntR family transcriptional regulator [Limnochordia bacterium]
MKGERTSEIVIRNSSEKPLYEQIKDQIKAQIIRGELAAGDQLPSMRYLAKELRISVITTKRAYDDLEQEGFIVSVQGKGSFVAAQNPEFLREEHLRNIEAHLAKALDLARLSGIPVSELKELLDVLNTEGEDNHE